MYMLKGHLNIDNSALMKKCLELSKTIHVEPGGYFVNVIDSHFLDPNNPQSNPHRWPEFQPVMDHLKTLVEDPGEITKSWFNVTLNGGVMKDHIHFQAPHSVFVYYINCNPDHPHLEFLVDDEWIESPCVSGDWLLFPKPLHHRVPENNSTGDRISISINIGKPKEL
jgi:hypothetical protein